MIRRGHAAARRDRQRERQRQDNARRSWRRWTGRESLWNGNRETLRGLFWGRGSLFGYALLSHFRRRREYPDELARFHVIRLRTPSEVASFLAAT